MLPMIARMFSGIYKFFFHFYECRCFILNQNIEITGSEQNILCEKKVPKHLEKFPPSHSGVYAEDGCPHGTSLSFRTRVPSNPPFPIQYSGCRNTENCLHRCLFSALASPLLPTTSLHNWKLNRHPARASPQLSGLLINT